MPRVVYVSYDAAQKLIPVFQYYAKKGPWREVREDSRIILRELEWVRPMSYAPFEGRQVFLNEVQHEFFESVANEVGV